MAPPAGRLDDGPVTPEQKRAQHDGRRCRDEHPGDTHARWAAGSPEVLAAMRAAADGRRQAGIDPIGQADPPPMTRAQVRAIVEVFDRHGVDYLLIGGMAGQLQGVGIETTRDADFNASRTPENLRRIAAALSDLRASVRTDADVHVALTPEFLQGMVSVQMLTDQGPMDINFRPDGTDGYEDLVRSAVVVQVDDVDVRTAAVSDIVRSKRAAGRAKDVAALPVYEAWLAEHRG